MNTSTKGQKKEKLCADELEAQGWTIEFRSQRLRFGRIDLGYHPTKQERAQIKDKTLKLTGWKAAMFDVEAIKQGIILRISCKNYGNNTHGSIAQEITNIKDYRMHHFLPPSIGTELWVWFAPRWRGRGKARNFETAHWDKTQVIC